MLSSRPVVAHTTKRYFKLSENWIHVQLKHLKHWQSLVLTQHTLNRDITDWWPEVHARAEDLPYLIQKLDGAVNRVMGTYPSRYLQARWRGVRLLHAHFGPVGFESLALSRALGVPLVTTFYGYDLSLLLRREPAWRARYETLFEKGNLFLAEGPHMAERIKDLGCPASKIRVHRLGIEPEAYPDVRRHKEFGDPLRVLMAGRFVEKKGMEDGVKAFARFLRAGGDGKLTIVGDAQDSKSSIQVKQRLLDTVEELGVWDYVRFLGLVPRASLRDVYYDSDVLLAPSRTAANGDNEGGAPVTTIEAQATAMPVIATHHCDLPDVISDQETGLLAEEGNIPQLADHLKTFHQSTRKLVEMGRQARLHVMERHNAADQGEKLSRIYESCVSGSGVSQ